MRLSLARAAARAVLLAGLASLTACRQDMHDQPKYRPYRSSAFFADGRSVRPAIPGTVARGFLNDDDWKFAGKKDGQWATDLPMPLNEKLVRRGQERYDIYCAPCHARTGEGDGMIVRRGYRRPPSLHDERLRATPAGYYFDVMTRGFGVMPDYAAQVDVEDRWAIVAYIRALQLSRNATLNDVPENDRPDLDRADRSGRSNPSDRSDRSESSDVAAGHPRGAHE